MARETVRKILLRNQGPISVLEQRKRATPRRIEVSSPRTLWGVNLTLVWVLGFWPVWVLGAVDYHGSRLVALEAMRWPSSAAIGGVLCHAFDRHGAPERMLTDRGSVFRSPVFETLLESKGVAQHTL